VRQEEGSGPDKALLADAHGDGRLRYTLKGTRQVTRFSSNFKARRPPPRRRMAEAGEIVRVRVLDHIVAGEPTAFVALRQRGGW